MKRLTNETPLEAGWTIAFRQDGRECIVVVAKGTFTLVGANAPGEQPRLTATQQPLLMADVFGLDPAASAPVFENDYAPMKPECDVVLSGAAHAPHGRAVRMLPVSLQVGPVSKSFHVTGDRAWRRGAVGPVPDTPEPMLVQSITYDTAFGGTEIDPANPGHVETFLDNPVGRGFRRSSLDLAGHAMPVTEELSAPIRDPRRAYRPMALGPLGRSWRPRAQYAGTYDTVWAETTAPMLPQDFDPRYFQSAPPDQRMPYPRGGEPVRLVNLVPTELRADASAATSVPRVPLAIVFLPARAEPIWADAHLDTILFEPDENRFACSWRASVATVRDAFEIDEAIVHVRSPRGDARLRAQLAGKEYFEGLGHLTDTREGRGL